MKLLNPMVLLSAALLSLVVIVPFLPFAKPKAFSFAFEVTVASSASGTVQLYYDIGRGMDEPDSVRVPIEGDQKPHHLRFAMPEGNYRALRFDPIDREGTISFGDALIRDPAGGAVRTFAPMDFIPLTQIERANAANGRMEITTTPGAVDPTMQVRIGEPFSLELDWRQNARVAVFRFLPVFAGILALLAVARRMTGRGHTLWTWLSGHPQSAVAWAAVISVVASSYPVIFLGKSIVSPNFGVTLLYDRTPTLPGVSDTQIQATALADIGAIMWQQVPLSMVQRDSILKDHELPFWNRYNSAGTVLIGQGQTMFGDPLHWPVILANGAAWAWDLKYLAAKWLLAFGLGLIVLRLTRHLPAALLVAGAADFVGYFVYRVNHPAIFSFCYAPWIIYCWMQIATAADRRRAAGWTLGLVIANAVEMNSGTVKEAYMLLLTMNLAGGLGLVIFPLPRLERLRRLGMAFCAGILFFLITAPIWLTFKDALHASYTAYNDPRAFQTQPSLLLGLFDEIFFRPFCVNEGIYNPSSNVLFLVGILACLVNLRALATNRLALAFGLAALVPLSLAFGLVPPQWIVHVPYLANVAQIDNTFSCGLVILIEILAGWGFATVAARPSGPSRGDFAIGALLLFALVFPYIAFTQTVQRSTYSYLHWGETLPYSPFVWGSLAVLLAAAAGFAIVSCRIIRHGPNPARILVVLACIFAMLWRHGWHVGMGFNDYVLNIPPRVDFHAASPAVSIVQARVASEPARVAGIEANLFPGWNDAYGLEGICSPDALMNPHYKELLETSGIHQVWFWRYVVHFETLAQLKPIYDFLNVRYYMDYKFGYDRMNSILSPVANADLDVYRSETAWPRAFFTDRVAVYGKVADLTSMIKSGDGRPFAAIQSGEADAPKDFSGNLDGRTIVPARNYRLTTNTTEFDVDASGPGVAVLEEAWLNKDFQVTMDGKPASYFRINHAFKGIRVLSPGVHRISFKYRPHHFTAALLFCGTGLALFAASGAWLVGRKRARPGLPENSAGSEKAVASRSRLTHI